MPLNPFERSNNKRTERGSMREERNIYAQIEEASDWVTRIRELRPREVIQLLRNPTNPAISYLLYMDGTFQGNYSSKRKLSASSVIMGDYLVFEGDTSRKTFRYKFTDLPVADGPEYKIDIQVNLKVDVEQPELLVDKGIWNIKDELSISIEDVVRRVSTNYKGIAQVEAEADIKREIEALQFADGYKIAEATVRRDVPAWVNEMRRKAAQRRQDEEERKLKQQEERRRKREADRLEAKRKREAEQERIRKEQEEAKRRALEQEERLRVHKETVARQRRYQELYDLHGIAGLKSESAAQQDPALRKELEDFIKLMQEREDQQYERSRAEDEMYRQRQLEDRDFDRQVEVEDRQFDRKNLLEDREWDEKRRQADFERWMIEQDSEVKRKLQVFLESRQADVEMLELLKDSGVLSPALLNSPQGIATIAQLLGGMSNKQGEMADIGLTVSKPTQPAQPSLDVGQPIAGNLEQGNVADANDAAEADYAYDADDDDYDMSADDDDDAAAAEFEESVPSRPNFDDAEPDMGRDDDFDDDDDDDFDDDDF